ISQGEPKESSRTKSPFPFVCANTAAPQPPLMKQEVGYVKGCPRTSIYVSFSVNCSVASRLMRGDDALTSIAPQNARVRVQAALLSVSVTRRDSFLLQAMQSSD